MPSQGASTAAGANHTRSHESFTNGPDTSSTNVHCTVCLSNGGLRLPRAHEITYLGAGALCAEHNGGLTPKATCPCLDRTLTENDGQLQAPQAAALATTISVEPEALVLAPPATDLRHRTHQGSKPCRGRPRALGGCNGRPPRTTRRWRSSCRTFFCHTLPRGVPVASPSCCAPLRTRRKRQACALERRNSVCGTPLALFILPEILVTQICYVQVPGRHPHNKLVKKPPEKCVRKFGPCGANHASRRPFRIAPTPGWGFSRIRGPCESGIPSQALRYP